MSVCEPGRTTAGSRRSKIQIFLRSGAHHQLLPEIPILPSHLLAGEHLPWRKLHNSCPECCKSGSELQRSTSGRGRSRSGFCSSSGETILDKHAGACHTPGRSTKEKAAFTSTQRHSQTSSHPHHAVLHRQETICHA